MKEISSPGPRKQQVFSPKRPVAALLVITAALSFAFLFASGDQTYAASSASASEYTHLAVSLIRPENPANISTNTPLSLGALVTTYGPNETIAKVEFYFSHAAGSGSTPTLIGTDQMAPYTMTWIPSVPDGYFVTAKAYDTLGHVATSAPLTVYVVVGTPSPQPPPEVIITITSPSNGVYTLPAQIPFTVRLDNVLQGGALLFYATLSPNGPTTQMIPSSSDPFSVTWVPPQPGLYNLKVQASFGDQQGTSDTLAVQINAPQISPTPAGGSCTVRYQLESQWSGGFNANVVLINTSSVPMNGWTLAFTFPGDQKITELWNGSSTQTGEQVTIVNLSYNGSIAPGGTVNLGFNGTWVSNDTSPTLFTLNGMTCST